MIFLKTDIGNKGIHSFSFSDDICLAILYTTSLVDRQPEATYIYQQRPSR